MNMHVCFMKSVHVHSVSKMPSIITIYGADIERKYSQVIQSSLTQCYHECILKENARNWILILSTIFATYQ